MAIDPDTQAAFVDADPGPGGGPVAVDAVAAVMEAAESAAMARKGDAAGGMPGGTYGQAAP